MITEFEDFCTWVFAVADDIWKEISPYFKRPGPMPECSDSELIAMALIGECRGWHVETELLSCWKEYRDMFHHIPLQSRFNRRRRNLLQAFTLIRQVILHSLDLSLDRKCIIDSLPTLVVHNFTLYLVQQEIGELLELLLARFLRKSRLSLATVCISLSLWEDSSWILNWHCVQNAVS